jgi:hypothetical protein
MHPDNAVPKPEGSDIKEVYAFYGLAAYMAQVVEKSMVSLLAILETEGRRITRADYDAIFVGVDSRTFGRLLRRLAKALPISPETEALLAEALERRNHLAHQFFADRAAAFMLDAGRRQMIEELRTFTRLFHRAEDEIAILCAPIMKKHGMTSDAVERKGQEMIAEFLARSRDAPTE